MVEDEKVFVSPNGRIWTAPTDRKCHEFDLDVVCPEDKLLRGVGMSAEEKVHFSGICEYGANQLLACYATWWEVGEERSWYTRSDFCKMCMKCPHARGVKDGFDPFYLSMFDAWYLRKKFSDRIAECNDHPKCFVYFVSDGERVKIGKGNNPLKRLRTLQTGNSRKLRILYLIPTDNEQDSFVIESELHRMYRHYATCGEWFDILDKINKESFHACFSASYYIDQPEKERNENIA